MRAPWRNPIVLLCVLVWPSLGGGPHQIPIQITIGCETCIRVASAATPCGCIPGAGCTPSGRSWYRVGCVRQSGGGSEWCDELVGPIGWTAPCVPTAIDNGQLFFCLGLTSLCGFPCAGCVAAPTPPTCGPCVACLASILLTSCADPCSYYTQGCIPDPTRVTILEGPGYACETGPPCPPLNRPDLE